MTGQGPGQASERPGVGQKDPGGGNSQEVEQGLAWGGRERAAQALGGRERLTSLPQGPAIRTRRPGHPGTQSQASCLFLACFLNNTGNSLNTGFAPCVFRLVVSFEGGGDQGFQSPS